MVFFSVTENTLSPLADFAEAEEPEDEEGTELLHRRAAVPVLLSVNGRPCGAGFLRKHPVCGWLCNANDKMVRYSATVTVSHEDLG